MLRAFIPALTSLFLMSPAVAQEAEAEADGTDMDLDPGRWTLSFDALGKHYDNFFHAPEGAPALDVTGVLFSPAAVYRVGTRRVDFETNLGATKGIFDIPGDADDFLDYRAQSKFGFQPSVRSRLSLHALLQHGHDPFGLDRTEFPSVRTADLDEWNQYIGGASLLFGAPGATFGLELGGNIRHKDYTTNERFTEFLNSEAVTVDTTLYYNYSAKTSALVDYSHSRISFEQSNVCMNPADGPGDPACVAAPDTREGTLDRLRVGARWVATGKTSGDVRVGARRRSFDNSDDEIEGLDWQAGVQWSPRALTEIDFRTGRSETDSYRNDRTRIIDVRSHGLAWNQQWTERLKSRAGVGFVEATFEGSGRVDELYRGSLGFDYVLDQAAALLTEVAYSKRDSSEPGRSYNQVTASIGFRFGG